MKISFDFDGTLDQEPLQVLAEYFINKGEDVWIVTARNEKDIWNRDLYSVAEYLGIPKEKIIFTNGSYKHEMLTKLNIEMHFDNDYLEHRYARNNNCKCIIVPILELNPQ